MKRLINIDRYQLFLGILVLIAGVAISNDIQGKWEQHIAQTKQEVIDRKNEEYSKARVAEYIKERKVIEDDYVKAFEEFSTHQHSGNYDKIVRMASNKNPTEMSVQECFVTAKLALILAEDARLAMGHKNVHDSAHKLAMYFTDLYLDQIQNARGIYPKGITCSNKIVSAGSKEMIYELEITNQEFTRQRRYDGL